jgi:NADPH:quinone reductase-like Zn-dependent oxidoreductase
LSLCSWTVVPRGDSHEGHLADRPRRAGEVAFPRIQGADIAGRIVAVGDGVPAARIGERVLVNPTLYSDQGDGLVGCGYIGSERDGGFAEFTAVPSANAVAVSTSLSDAELATFPTAYLTAEHMLNRARLTNGETVLITGASGGVGSALIQLARIRRATVVAVVGAGKQTLATDLGAAAVIGRDTADLEAAVRATTAARPIDVVADVVGGPTFPQSMNVLRPQGRYVTAGAIAGPVVPLDLRTLYLRHLELIGSTLGTAREFADLIGYIETGRIRPLLAGTYPLAELTRAQDDFKRKGYFGKLVVLPRP